MTRCTVLILLCLFTSACATVFTGSAQVEGGRAGCERKCNAEGLQLAGMVFMGEYSDACVCQVPGATAMTPVAMASSATAGGAAGVYMQMMRQQQQRQ